MEVNTLNNNIGERIGELIKALNVKTVCFAEWLKIDQSYITQLTNRKEILVNELFLLSAVNLMCGKNGCEMAAEKCSLTLPKMNLRKLLQHFQMILLLET